uniref:PHD-type domain-containing protein n=1 Tax=Cucumis melo TaxID=3656 RepID=A0A9I9CW33_CUCME
MGEEAAVLAAVTNEPLGKENASSTELKRDHQCLDEDTEPESLHSKKQAKEVSNEDVRSEVSNPVVSPKENHFHDITSQPEELENTTQVERGELTSACSGNSSSEDISSDGVRCQNNMSQNDVDMCDVDEVSRVVIEVPKHASSTGIRKITFKFSKKKDNNGASISADKVHSYGNSDRDGKPEPSLLDDACTETSAHSWEGFAENSRYSLGPNKMELKMSKKVLPNNYPSNVKKLLSTGILDGARVKYVSTTSEMKLQGIINGGGYMCGCSTCNFTAILSAYEFEQHAGFKTRHPNNHIYLENGRPIYSVIQEIKSAPLSILDEVIMEVAGSSVNMNSFEAWKASFHQDSANIVVENHDVKLPKLSHPVERPNPNFSNAVLQHKKTAEKGTKRRDNDLHRLLFMPNGLPDGAELAYFVKGQRILGGFKQGNGILCSHCNREISPSQFEAHAGMAARRQPYRHIYTTNGLTLHDIAISLASGQKLTTGDSDDMCAACGNGGDLIFCDRCPRAYHTGCLHLQNVPEGVWSCPNCRDKVGSNSKAISGGSLSFSKPIVFRLTRVVKAPEYEIGGCVITASYRVVKKLRHDFSAAKFDDRTVLLCDQCEREFHVGCLRDSGLCDLKELPKDKWFCCDECSNIHVALQNTVLNGAQTIPDSLSDLIIRKHVGKGLLVDGALNDVRWQILSGKSRYPEDLPFLSRATAIFRECFDPIVAKSGRDLIPVMVYGRNISGQEFGGMYCVVLIVRSIVVSAGLLRIFGREVAELPIVATSREHQGKGYFQVLFSCIERLLSSLNVQNLVLPAAEDAESIWTKKLGFRKMSEEQLIKYMREVQLTIFNGTSMLEKVVQQSTL